MDKGEEEMTDRLLTLHETAIIKSQCIIAPTGITRPDIRDYVEKVKEAQDAKTHALDLQHEQETKERIKRDLEKLLPYSLAKSNPFAWQEFWKQEGVK